MALRNLRFITKVGFRVDVEDKRDSTIKGKRFRKGDEVRFRQFGSFVYDYKKFAYVRKCETFIWADNRKTADPGLNVKNEDCNKVIKVLLKARLASAKIERAEAIEREQAARRPATPKERFERTFAEVE